MKLQLNNTEFVCTNKPLDISLSLHNGEHPVLAWYCEPIKLEPVMTDRFIGDVNQGGAVNFRNLFMNPHGNGTHTECVGHISKEFYSINKCLQEYHFFAHLISVEAEKVKNEEFDTTDQIITRAVLVEAMKDKQFRDEKVLIIRSLPNGVEKKRKNYSNTNPTYFSADAIRWVNELGVDHLMVDVPSIDREEDKGELIGHHIFWNYPDDPQMHKTISELIYVPNTIKDGRYLCNIQITSLENDASPSKITLYEIHKN